MSATVPEQRRRRSRSPLLGRSQTLTSLSDKLSGLVLERRTGRLGYIGFAVTGAATLSLFFAMGYLFAVGVGIWGINIPVAWGFAIANYVWWIGIGMSGTFISTALMLTRQDWRTAINRAAETMTVFAVSIAGLFPIMHLGRPWFAYWIFPHPDTMGLWPQWRSSLTWDFAAITAYLTVSLLMWFVGMMPDLAALRDRAKTRRAQIFYGLLALGWRGEARHWARYEKAMALLAGIAVTLVFSVHSMVGLDVAAQGITPGWHSTMWPPYFVAGAIYSGFGLVMAILIPMRRVFGLHDYITAFHLDKLAKGTLALGLVMTYCYFMEVFMAYYSGDKYELEHVHALFFGAYNFTYWTAIACNSILVQALWFRRVRHSPIALFFIGAAVVFGMWVERVMIVIPTLYKNYIPSEWGMFYPTAWDWTHLLTSLGFFGFLFLLFLRLVPAISIFEMRKLIVHKDGK